MTADAGRVMMDEHMYPRNHHTLLLVPDTKSRILSGRESYLVSRVSSYVLHLKTAVCTYEVKVTDDVQEGMLSGS